jgi:Lon protease-like protein
MDLSFDASLFSGWAPLFPLPSVVLLPGGLLPLHVFEPRYRELLKDALEDEKLIAMALLLPGFEQDYQGSPEIDEWVGLGRIVAHESLADGRSNLLLAGLRRARVIEEDRSRAYRKAQLEVVEDDELGLGDDEAAALRATIESLVERAPGSLVRDPVRLGVARKLEVPLGAWLDLVGDALALTVREKQRLLATAHVKTRAERLAQALRSVMGLDRRPIYPPRFSNN